MFTRFPLWGDDHWNFFYLGSSLLSLLWSGGLEWAVRVKQWKWRWWCGAEEGVCVCLLNPTNPVVLNLCLPAPEEEVTGQTLSVPSATELYRLQRVTPPASGCELHFYFFLFISVKQNVIRSSCEDAAFYSDLILFAEELKYLLPTQWALRKN